MEIRKRMPIGSKIRLEEPEKELNREPSQRLNELGPSLLKRRVLVFIGGYGAGKTQVSLSMALRLAREGKRVALADLDLINPYFRSREMAATLESAGIRVLRPAGEWALAENPSLPPAIEGALRDETQHVILDAGGDEAGATILGRYHTYTNRADAAVLQVVNVFRPFSTNVEEIVALQRSLEQKAHCRVSGWIHNSNLQGWTTLEDWQQAQTIMEDLVQTTGIPLAAQAVDRKWADKIGLTWQAGWIPIERFLNLGWRLTRPRDS